jgi:hypothetical protein
MKKNVLLLAAAMVMSLGYQSCNEDKVDNTAKVQLKLIDAPGDYEEVNVEIIDIQYNNSEDEEGWKSFTPEGGYPINIDLTELIAGNSLLLTDEIIPSGMLKQIRLVLSDNNYLVIEDLEEPVHLYTPSAQQSGLKLKLDTELEPGFSYTFILDWDVQRSIVKAGNSGRYNLKPVIRVNTVVNSGSISGKVIGEVQGDDIDGPVPLEGIVVRVYKADAVEGDEHVTETSTNVNGEFLFQGLDAGDYKIKIEDNSYIDFVSEEAINVSVGVISDTGTIELKVPVT